MIRTVDTYDLGEIHFAEAWDLQRAIFEEVCKEERKDTLLLLEHPHVFTLGRVTQQASILFNETRLAELDAEMFEIDRGGDVTYHGPGQLVGYPILKLSHFKEDLGWYLRALEESIIVLLASYSIEAFRVQGRTGVWVKVGSTEEKICAIGIKASRWCTMHGFALNVNTDLQYFEHIVPCGIADKNVTSLSKLLGREIEMGEVKSRYREAFAKVFEVDIVTRELSQLPDRVANSLPPAL
ncbi:MAG TPA: lipoyl(octanoyl) transferase LipB [Candidatus Kapabacteria bacterium]|nr:lipoyl(octanoyl) transferase LipB [Candidatus Kapabacteria bacterium]